MKFLIIIISALTLAACQTTNVSQKKLSVEEAKEVAITLETTSFAKAPRSLKAFGQNLKASYFDLNEHSQCVKPSEIVTKEDVNDFAKIYSSDDKSWALRKKAEIEHKAGSISNAITYALGAVKYTPSKWRGEKSWNNLTSAIFIAEAGDFKRSKTFYNRGIDTNPSSGWKQGCKYVQSYMSNAAKGASNLSKGSPENAENNYRIALQNLIAFRDYGSDWDGTSGCEIRSQRHDIFMQIGLSKSLLLQGHVGEAETVLRDGWKNSRYYPDTKPSILAALTDVYYEQGRFLDSYKISLLGIEKLNSKCIASDALIRSKMLSVSGRAAITLKKWDEAIAIFDQLETNLKIDEPELWEKRFKFDKNRGLAFLQQSKYGQALEIFNLTYDTLKVRLGDNNFQVLEAQAFIAATLTKQGKYSEALSIMREVYPEMIVRWRDGGGDSTNLIGRTLIMRILGEVYLRLLVDDEYNGNENNSKNIAESLQIADALGARGVQRALAESAARFLTDDPALQELIRQRQDLEKRVSAIRSKLNEASGSRDVSKETVEALKLSAETAEAALRGLDAEVGLKIPEYANLTNPKPITVDEVKKYLENGESLILTFSGDDKLFTWAVPKEGDASIYVADIGRNDLKDMVDELRFALAPEIETLGDIPEFDVELGYEIYEATIGGIKNSLQNINRLLVVSDGPLGTIPFAVLPTKEVEIEEDEEVLFVEYRAVPWLLHDYAIAQLPSASALQTLRGVKRGEAPQFAFAGFGQSYFDRDGNNEVQVATNETRGAGSLRGGNFKIRLRNAPQTRGSDSAILQSLPFLPDTGEEIEAIADTLGASLGSDIYLGLKASERQVKELNDSGKLKQYRTLSFATHGLIPGDLDGLTRPALALTEPTQTDIEQFGDDGLLTSDEIMGLKLNTDWTVLSACNTAAGDGEGAEAISGLGLAFIYAGSRSILVSNWPVHSEATRDLMTGMFKNYADADFRGRSDALQKSMQTLIHEGGFRDENGEVLFTFAHPLFFAPFSLVGDGA